MVYPLNVYTNSKASTFFKFTLKRLHNVLFLISVPLKKYINKIGLEMQNKTQIGFRDLNYKVCENFVLYLLH